MPPTGKGTGTGVCKNGTDGLAFELTDTINLRRTYGATVDTFSLTLAGKVAVTSRKSWTIARSGC